MTVSRRGDIVLKKSRRKKSNSREDMIIFVHRKKLRSTISNYHNYLYLGIHLDIKLVFEKDIILSRYVVQSESENVISS